MVNDDRFTSLQRDNTRKNSTIIHVYWIKHVEIGILTFIFDISVCCNKKKSILISSIYRHVMTSHFTIENLTPTDWPNICTNNYNLSLSHANFFSLFLRMEVVVVGEGDIYVKISSIPIFVIYALRGQCILLVFIVFFSKGLIFQR